MSTFLDYNRTIVGYHGTSAAKAELIVRTQTFRPSLNQADWLGHGVYFWEHAPKQALAWAERRYPGQGAVVASMIRLGNCLDLLDPDNAMLLRSFHDRLSQTLAERGESLPQNQNANKYRDAAVFQSYYAHVAEQGTPLDSARAVYVPTPGTSGLDGGGTRLWTRSWLTLDAHIQIVIRPEATNRCILGTWPVIGLGRERR